MKVADTILHEVILLPSFTQVLNYQKQVGSADNAGLFGATVTTPNAWLADLWELFGTGETLISDTERISAVARALQDFDKQEYLTSDGFARVVAHLVKEGVGLEPFEKACKAVSERIGAHFCAEVTERFCAHLSREVSESSCADLCAQERDMLKVCAAYFDIIDKAHLIEPGKALRLLPSLLPEIQEYRVQTIGLEPLSQQWCDFFAQCPQCSLWVHAPLGSEGVVSPQTGAQVRFVFPAGHYARAHLLLDEITKAHSACIVVAASDARATFYEIAPALARAGINVDLRARRLFSQTHFGQAFLLTYKLAHDKASLADLIDLLHLPLSGIPKHKVCALDAAMRGDRLSSVADRYREILRVSEFLSYLEEMVLSPEACVLSGAIEDYLYALEGFDGAYIAEQISALRTACEIMQQAARFGLGGYGCVRILANVSVDVSAHLEADRICSGETEVTESRDVLVCTWAHAAKLESTACEVLFTCDADNVNHALTERADAHTTLFRKLGIELESDTLGRARREFSALAQVPSKELVIERCLYNVDAEPTYPAMVVEELIDCYRDDPAATDDIDNPYALPPYFLKTKIERGEGYLFENASLKPAPQEVSARISYLDASEIYPESRPYVVLSRVPKTDEVRLSPSQIESYLACPYLWFVSRRLHVESLEEDFGPLQMGDFAHQALQHFYERFQKETGQAKVTCATLAHARAIMQEVLDADERAQSTLSPEDNRLIPLNELEAREFTELKNRLINFLDYETVFLPTFSPKYFEYEIGKDEPITYAGVRLTGKIDRIDVDEQGRAVIVDYKSSVSDEYELMSGGQALPRKVQTLIYALVVKRLLGLEVVGALYVSYGRKIKLAGAYDPIAIDVSHLPNIRKDKCKCEIVPDMQVPTFDVLLEQTERRLESVISHLLAGDVTAQPLGAFACKYCPYMACAERKA